MSLLVIGVILTKGATITVAGSLYNLFFVTLGNILGGVLLGVIYHYISNKKVENKKTSSYSKIAFYKTYKDYEEDSINSQNKFVSFFIIFS